MAIFADISQSPLVRSVERAVERSDRLVALRRRLVDAWMWVIDDPKRRRRAFVGTTVSVGVLIIGTVIGAWLLLRPMPKPNYENDSIYKVFKYTLLTDEFNKLSIEERLRLIGMIRARLEDLSSSESTLLAAFAAGIAGKSRQQLEENISRLLIDAWDLHATEYLHVAPEDRKQFVEDAFVEIHEMLDTLEDGNLSDMTREQRLAEGRKQAQEDVETIREGNGLSPRALARVGRLMRDGVNGYASAQQRARSQQLLRDMTRDLRAMPGGG